VYLKAAKTASRRITKVGIGGENAPKGEKSVAKAKRGDKQRFFRSL
jgi:hypothetical protein